MAVRFKYVAILAAVFMLLFSSFAPRASAFDLFGSTCQNDKVQGGNNNKSPVCTSNNAAKNDDGSKNVVLETIKSAANIIAFISGVIAVIIIIISGLSLIGSGGKSESIANARRRIIYAAVGLAVIALAWTITSFVIQKVI